MSTVQPVHPGLEAMEDGFFMVDRDWRVTYWNAAAERLLGVTREQALGCLIWELAPVPHHSPTWLNLHAARAEQTARRFLDTHPGAADSAYLSIHAAPLDDDGLAVHFRDATEEVQRGEQYSLLLESIRDGFLAVDADWNLVYFNSVAEALLRLPRERALGFSLWSLLPRLPVEAAEGMRATMEDRVQRHVREVRPQGRMFHGRPFDLWTFPLPGGGISILFEDVGERVQHEYELARLAAEAQEANRAKGRFFAAISHELRTPLNAIVGYTHLLATQTYGSMPAAATRAAERASVCAEHLSRLIDDVLLMTTAEIDRLPVVPVPVSIPELLPEIVEPIRHQAEAKQLRFHLSLPEHLPTVQTDPQRLRQLLLALLTNAVKFTHKGSVRLEVEVVGGQGEGEQREEHDGVPPGAAAAVEFRVVDTGPGIPPEARERIFGPFEQLGDSSRSDSMTRGTGLGLTVARKVAALLRGDLSVEDAPESGSLFRLRLPLRPSGGAT